MVPVDVMLAIEQVHGSKEMKRGSQRAFTAGRAMLVLHNDRRFVPYGPTCLPSPQAPVKILTIHKEAIVQHPDTLDDAAPHQQAGAADRVDLDRYVRIDERQVVSTEARTLWKQPTKTRQTIERDRRRRKRAPARQMGGAIGTQQL